MKLLISFWFRLREAAAWVSQFTCAFCKFLKLIFSVYNVEQTNTIIDFRMTSATANALLSFALCHLLAIFGVVAFPTLACASALDAKTVSWLAPSHREDILSPHAFEYKYLLAGTVCIFFALGVNDVTYRSASSKVAPFWEKVCKFFQM